MRLQISIQPVEQMKLGAYPAMTLRGGLGYALRNVICQCETPHDVHCAYSKLYEACEGQVVDGEYIPYSRPFIIRTGENTKFLYKKNETYTFELLLFGEAIDYLNSFIIALQKFGDSGIGKEKDMFFVKEIASIDACNGHVKMIYANKQLIGTPIYNALTLSPTVSQMQQVRVQFTSPVRLKMGGDYVDHMDAVILIDNLCRRLNSLLYYHGNKQQLPATLVSQCVDEAFQAKVVDAQLVYKKHVRISTRQQKDIYMDGLMGDIIFTNVTPLVYTLLSAGTNIHIGKQSAFGLGQYKVQQYGDL